MTTRKPADPIVVALVFAIREAKRRQVEDRAERRAKMAVVRQEPEAA